MVLPDLDDQTDHRQWTQQHLDAADLRVSAMAPTPPQGEADADCMDVNVRGPGRCGPCPTPPQGLLARVTWMGSFSLGSRPFPDRVSHRPRSPELNFQESVPGSLAEAQLGGPGAAGPGRGPGSGGVALPSTGALLGLRVRAHAKLLAASSPDGSSKTSKSSFTRLLPWLPPSWALGDLGQGSSLPTCQLAAGHGSVAREARIEWGGRRQAGREGPPPDRAPPVPLPQTASRPS